MGKRLRDYFPMIRTREEVMGIISGNAAMSQTFYSWEEKYRKEFLDFCTGARGVKMLYDGFFKEILNPESEKERLERFLSLILNQTIQIKEVLPNDTVRLADETTLLVTDILVQLEDGSLVNLEVQKIGYHFPGERAACYSADALLRQYKRVRGKRKKSFSYRDIKRVYLVVLFENSPKEVKVAAPEYLHRGCVKFDTSLSLEMLQNYIFVGLDIFRESLHNKGIGSELEAWLTFLCSDDPEQIAQLLQDYPFFRELYEDVYSICQNVEGMIGMYSKELQMMDRNTVRYMIDEMQEELDRRDAALGEKDAIIREQNEALKAKDEEIERLKAESRKG